MEFSSETDNVDSGVSFGMGYREAGLGLIALEMKETRMGSAMVLLGRVAKWERVSCQWFCLF